MSQPFIADLDYLGYTTRLKRLSDNIMHSGRKLYSDLNLDIEPNWFLIFRILGANENMSVTDISEAVGLSHPSIIAIVRQMTKKGFVESRTDPNDARRKVLVLTPKAMTNLPKYEEVWQCGLEAMSEALDHLDALSHLERVEAIFAHKDFRRRVLEKRLRTLKIDHAPHSQLKEFERLNLHWIEKYFFVEDVDRHVLGHAKEYILDQGGFIFNATLNDLVIGTVALIRREPHVFELSKMAVTENFQGFGIGQRLMEHCIDFANHSGIKTLFLDSNTKLVPAISLYRKMGFVEIPTPDDTPYERCNIRMAMTF